MELFNTIAKQSASVQSTAETHQTKSAPVQEIKTPVEKIQEKATSESKSLSSVEAKDLIDSLNKALDPFNTTIRFGFDNSDEVFFVSVVDTQSDKVIRRFPADQAHSLSHKINELVGIIFDQKG